MNSDDKPKLPNGADRLVDVGECPEGGRHVAAMKGDTPIALTHMVPVLDGQPLPPDCDIYYCDQQTGEVVDSVRIGSGPAQVATEAYRENWESIFGPKDSKEMN